MPNLQQHPLHSEIKAFLDNCHRKGQTRKIVKYPEYVAYLNQLYPGVELHMQLHSFIRNTSPYCIICSTPVKHPGKTCCSHKCSDLIPGKHEKRIEKQKQTLIEKYGVENPSQILGVQDRRKATMMEKYGALVSPITLQKSIERVPHLISKGRATLLANYGVTNPGQIPNHREKCIATLVDHYGVSNYFDSAESRGLVAARKQIKWLNLIPETIELVSITRPVGYKDDTFDNPNDIITFKCNTCGVSDSLPSETTKWRLRKTGTCCCSCIDLSNGSLLEYQIRTYVQSLGFTTVNNRRPLDGREIDIFIPDRQLGIEFHGLFWHNDSRCDADRHIWKLNTANRLNIRLIQIFEDEWLYKQEIVKSEIARLLTTYSLTINILDCSIDPVDELASEQFITTNSLIDFVPGSINIGLYHNQELVSIMSVLELTDTQWILLGLHQKLHTEIKLNAAVLFSYFVQVYQPDQIISITDRRWGNGEMQQELNFKHIEDSPINHWYVDPKPKTRIAPEFIDSSEDDPALSESENRFNQGYLRIWDCGVTKWVWSKE